MGDRIYESLKSKVSKNTGLIHQLVVMISEDEMEVLNKKADDLNMSKEELGRIYLTNTPIFTDPNAKKSKAKKPKKDVQNGTAQEPQLPLGDNE